MLQIVTFVNRLIRTFALFTDITKQRCACSVIFFKLWKIKYPLERIVPVREINNEIQSNIFRSLANLKLTSPVTGSKGLGFNMC